MTTTAQAAGYSIEQADAIHKLASDAIDNRFARIAKGETDMDDCFISQKFDTMAVHKANMMREIVKNGGRHEFKRVVLCDLNGVQIPNCKLMDTKYGLSFAIKNDDGTTNWVAAFPKKRETHAKKGVKVMWRTFTAPAFIATIAGSGGGMCAAFTATDEIVPAKFNQVTMQNEEQITISLTEFAYDQEAGPVWGEFA